MWSFSFLAYIDFTGELGFINRSKVPFVSDVVVGSMKVVKEIGLVHVLDQPKCLGAKC